MVILKPLKLNIGDTIGTIAASLPVLEAHLEKYERGKKILQDMGFKIKEGKTIGKQRWWMAGTPKDVADDINSMFADESIKAIIAHTGGYSAISVIDYLDYELITSNPKPFIGMSDMTIYHLAILAKCKVVGFHMDDLLHFNQEFFLKFLTKEEAPGIIKPITDWEIWKKGEAEGILIGGILERISILSGTKYFPPMDSFDGAILFWEEIGRDLSEIHQYLYQLKNMGIFDRISGMLIGKIKYIKPLRQKVEEPTLKDMVLEILKDYKFPIMANMDFGHFTINIPMPIGIKVSFDTNKKELNFLENVVV